MPWKSASSTPLLNLITPDWQINWTTKEIAEELPGFKFLGVGWYSKDGAWMLIINTDTLDNYHLQVWYDRDPRNGYDAIAQAPVRAHNELSPQAEPIQYMGLLVFVIGLVMFLPLSGFLFHKFHFWGMLLSSAFLFVWWWLTKLFSKKPKTSAEKKI